MDERQSVVLIEALANVWSAIRGRHPDVPPVVIIPAPAARGEMNVLGHFSALRWKGKHQGQFHEVVVVAEHLDRPAEEVVETLLHEAAHAMNFQRWIHDCSRSQYHNQHFRHAAEELGLAVQQVQHYGFAKTTMRSDTAAKYLDQIAALREVLIHRRKPMVINGGPGPPAGPTGGGDDYTNGTSRSRKATCRCPFIIRVSKKTMADTTIRCESCGEKFRLVE